MYKELLKTNRKKMDKEYNEAMSTEKERKMTNTILKYDQPCCY